MILDFHNFEYSLPKGAFCQVFFLNSPVVLEKMLTICEKFKDKRGFGSGELKSSKVKQGRTVGN